MKVTAEHIRLWLAAAIETGDVDAATDARAAMKGDAIARARVAKHIRAAVRQAADVPKALAGNAAARRRVVRHLANPARAIAARAELEKLAAAGNETKTFPWQHIARTRTDAPAGPPTRPGGEPEPPEAPEPKAKNKVKYTCPVCGLTGDVQPLVEAS